MVISQNRKRQFRIIGITCIIAWGFTFLALDIIPAYSFGLFIWLPILIGYLSTVLYGFKYQADKKSCRNVAFSTLVIYCLGLLFFAFEGVICIIMAAPIGLFFTWLGYLLGYFTIKNTIHPAIFTVALIIAIPGLMSFDYYHKNDDLQLRTVTSSVIIKASPEKVWRIVIAFPKLKPPSELLFKAGIAYPIYANINGTGVGAIRHCNFSTGSFVEPITTWNEPNLLQFDVAEQPETMKELSFYNLQPNHLLGYFISKRGQFKLTKLVNGNTLLEGTTWYYNKIKPNAYWDIWSDYIVHKIHDRVLSHIQEVAEYDN